MSKMFKWLKMLKKKRTQKSLYIPLAWKEEYNRQESMKYHSMCGNVLIPDNN